VLRRLDVPKRAKKCLTPAELCIMPRPTYSLVRCLGQQILVKFGQAPVHSWKYLFVLASFRNGKSNSWRHAKVYFVTRSRRSNLSDRRRNLFATSVTLSS
jgi:hypothetical protein